MIGTATLLAALLAMPLGQRSSNDTFRSIRTFRCDFTESVGRRGAISSIAVEPSSRLADLVFDSVDYVKGTARFIGNAGSENVVLIEGEQMVSFLDVTPSGNVATTSIYRAPIPRQLGRHRAVMSRHLYILLGGGPDGLAPELVMSQFYGECRALL